MKRFLAVLLVGVMMIPLVAWAKDVVIRDETTGQEMIYNTETGKVYPKGASTRSNGGSTQTGPMADEKGVPGLYYSEVPGVDPLEKRAITGPGFVVYGRNRDLNGAVRVEVVPLTTKSYKNDIFIVDENGKRIHAEGTVRVYMKLPKNVKRPVVVRVEDGEMHFAEVEGTDYIWFPYEF